MVVPDQWRVRAMNDPEVARLLLLKRRDLEFLDWESTRVGGPSCVVVPAVDLSVAEFVVKLPKEIEVAAVDLVLTPRFRRVRGGGIEALLGRARSRFSTLAEPVVSHDRFPWAIDALIRQAATLPVDVSSRGGRAL